MAVSAPSSVELRTGDSEALDITPFVDRFEWVESMISGGFSWDLQFKAEQWREWDRLMFGRDEPTYQFRMRSTNDSGEDSTEWRTAITDKSRAGFGQDVSMRGQVKGADRRLDMAQIARNRKWSESRVSEVLSQIANEYSLTPNVERSASLDTYTQNRINDWAFARTLAGGATTESGRCDTYLWIEEDILHFGSPQFTDASERRYDLSVVENRVDNYAVAYHGREADRKGAARLRGVGFNWRTKSAVTFTMGPGQAQSQPSLARRVPRRMADGLRIYPVFEEARDVVEEAVRARWGRVAPRYLSLNLNTRPDLTLRPNKVISLEANLDTRRETPFMGRYAVLEVRHVFEDGAIQTSIVCYRREAQEGEAQPTGADADIPNTRDRNQLVPTQRTILVARGLS